MFGRYFVIANAVVSVYSFLVLFLPEESLLWKFVVVLDLVTIYIFVLLFIFFAKRFVLIIFMHSFAYYFKVIKLMFLSKK